MAIQMSHAMPRARRERRSPPPPYGGRRNNRVAPRASVLSDRLKSGDLGRAFPKLHSMSIDQLFGSFLGLSLVSSLDANSEDYVAILAHHVSIKSAHAPRSKTL